MSFILQYRRLFSVFVEEDGNSQRFERFLFRPTAVAEECLANHQLVFKSRVAGFEVYYRLNPLAPNPLLGEITSRVRFSFALIQWEHGFLERYEPNLTSETGPQLYFDNLTPAGDIQPNERAVLSTGNVVDAADAMRIYRKIVPASVDLSASDPVPEEVTFTVRGKFTNQSVEQKIKLKPEDLGRGQTEIDVSKLSSGLYTLETDVPDSLKQTIYVDHGLAGGGIFSVVDIYWESAQTIAPMGGVPYVIRFKKR